MLLLSGMLAVESIGRNESLSCQVSIYNVFSESTRRLMARLKQSSHRPTSFYACHSIGLDNQTTGQIYLLHDMDNVIEPFRARIIRGKRPIFLRILGGQVTVDYVILHNSTVVEIWTLAPSQAVNVRRLKDNNSSQISVSAAVRDEITPSAQSLSPLSTIARNPVSHTFSRKQHPTASPSTGSSSGTPSLIKPHSIQGKTKLDGIAWPSSFPNLLPIQSREIQMPLPHSNIFTKPTANPVKHHSSASQSTVQSPTITLKPSSRATSKPTKTAPSSAEILSSSTPVMSTLSPTAVLHVSTNPAEKHGLAGKPSTKATAGPDIITHFPSMQLPSVRPSSSPTRPESMPTSARKARTFTPTKEPFIFAVVINSSYPMVGNQSDYPNTQSPTSWNRSEENKIFGNMSLSADQNAAYASSNKSITMRQWAAYVVGPVVGLLLILLIFAYCGKQESKNESDPVQLIDIESREGHSSAISSVTCISFPTRSTASSMSGVKLYESLPAPKDASRSLPLIHSHQTCRACDALLPTLLQSDESSCVFGYEHSPEVERLSCQPYT